MAETATTKKTDSKQRIRIRLKAYDHKVIDQAANRSSIRPYGPALLWPDRFRCRLTAAPTLSLKARMSSRKAGSNLR